MPECATLPTFQIEDRTFTRIILGHNPLLGYSYLSNARCKEYTERFATYEPIRDVIVAALGMGVRSIMVSPGSEQCDRLAQAVAAQPEHQFGHQQRHGESLDQTRDQEDEHVAHAHPYVGVVRQFIAGCRDAAEAGEPLTFG